MQAAPMRPVKVMATVRARRGGATRRYNRVAAGVPAGAATAQSSPCPSRTQGPDRAPARAARRLPLLQRAGETIYVGKARVLRDRVRSYLGAYGTSPKTDALLDEADRLEVIVTDSVVEALALENNLIKQRVAALQHPAARRQELPLPAADHGRGVPAACTWPGAWSATGTSTPGPFLPASLARRTMGLTHRLFGIRSCNEVITGAAGPAVPRVRHQPLPRAVRGGAVLAGALRRGGRGRAAAARGAQRRTDRRADRHACSEAAGRRAVRAGGAAARRHAHAGQTLRDRQQKMATPRLGDRDAFGREGRAAGRGRAGVPGPARAASSIAGARQPRSRRQSDEADVLEAGAAAVLPGAGRRRPRCTCPCCCPTTPSGSRTGCRTRAGRRVAHRRAAARREARAARPRRAQRGARVRHARSTRPGRGQLRRAGHAAGGARPAAVPRRIECFDISTIQGSETVASMVVCEDGRMKRERLPQVPRPRRARPARPTAASRPTTSPPCARSSAAGTGASLEEGGPLPDLIVIDGGKGQLSAAYEALEESGLSTAGGGGPGQEGGTAVHARPRRAAGAAAPTARRCGCCSASATRRTASR